MEAGMEAQPASGSGDPAVSLNRKCTECKAPTAHIRGLHVVHSTGSLFFCSKRCRSKFKLGSKQIEAGIHTRNITELIESNVLFSSDVGDDCLLCNWPDLPDLVLWGVMSHLELWDVLSLGCTCRKWMRAVALAPGSESVRVAVPHDPGLWSRTIHLMPLLQGQLTSLEVTINPGVNATCSLQVLSRCTQLAHLSLIIYDFASTRFSSNYYTNDSRTWLAAIARISNLRTLKILAPATVELLPGGLSALSFLSRLHIECHGSGWSTVSRDADMGTEISDLATLPLLKDLTIPDEMTCTPAISLLTGLTSLSIQDLDHYQYVSHDAPDMYFVHLTHLQKLTISTRQFLGHHFDMSYHHTIAGSWLHRLHDRLLHQNAELSLFLDCPLRLPATPGVMDHLAALTQLTSLKAYLSAPLTPGTSGSLKPLCKLINLRSLQILQWGVEHLSHYDAARHEPLTVDLEAMNYICWHLSRLTQLVLAVRPLCFLGSWDCFKHLGRLTDLKTLELGSMPDTIATRYARVWDEEFPVHYLPPGLESCTWYDKVVDLSKRGVLVRPGDQEAPGDVNDE